MKYFLLLAGCLLTFHSFSQKKPLDHTVYDDWQSIGERAISNDGHFVTYVINPQEGDGKLVIQQVNGTVTKEIPRGYNAVITDDSRFVICRIKAPYKDTRDAKIKKKRPDEMPKDSLAIFDITISKLVKIPRVKNYKLPEESSKWLAYLSEKPLIETMRPVRPDVDSATRINALISMADSLVHVADSLRNKANDAKTKGMAVLQNNNREGRNRNAGATANRTAGAAAGEDPVEEGTDLVLHDFSTGKDRIIKLVTEYYFNKNGQVLLYETSKKANDSTVLPSVTRLDLTTNMSTVIFKKFNDAKSYVLDESGNQVAFLAERDSSSKALQKFYQLYYYKTGQDSAQLIAKRGTFGY